MSRNTQASELENEWTGIREEFDPQLSTQLKSVDDLLNYVQENCKAAPTSLEYINFIDSTIRKRFYHTYSHYTMNNNWLAALGGSLVWDHISAVVIPDDIMKYPYAACSQQSIVFMECCKRLGIDYRRVGFDHHYALELKIDGKWYFFDTNMELKSTGRTSFEQYASTNSLYHQYQDKLNKDEFAYVFANPTFGPVNEVAASKVVVVHQATSLLSQLLFWSFILVQLVMLRMYWKQYPGNTLLAKA